MVTTAKNEVSVVEGQARGPRGKNEARRVRCGGRIPAVLYGAKKETVALSVDPKQIARILHSESGHNTIFELFYNGERTKAMIVDWQYEPIKGALLHIDLKRIDMGQRLQVKVPIVLRGEAAGVKQQGGILEQVLREVEVECLPGDIPTHLEMDVSELVFGKVQRVSELPHAEGKLRFLTPADQTVAHIVSVKEVAVPTPEAAAAEAAAAPAEPEVIKKGKQEAAEEGAAEAEKPEKAEKAERKEKKEK